MGFLQPNYNKEGHGVYKNAPQKKEFVRFLEIYARKFWHLMVANLLYVLAALPIITCGLADAGLTHITRNFSREKFSFLREDFLETIKKNWKQALPIGILNLVITLVLLYDIVFFYTNGDGVSGVVMLAIILVISVIFVFMRYYIPLLTITFRLPIRHIYKDAFLLALAGLKRNLVISLVLVFLYALAGALMWVNLTVGLAVVILVYLFVFPAFRSFLIQFCIFPVVKQHLIDPYYRERPDEDVDKRKDLNLYVEDEEGGEEVIFEDTPPAEEPAQTSFTLPKQYSRERPTINDDDDTI